MKVVNFCVHGKNGGRLLSFSYVRSMDNKVFKIGYGINKY